MMTPMPDAEERLATLGSLIRQRRDKEMHLSALEAAQRANVARQTWADVEAGRKRAQRGTYEKIERLLEWAPGACLTYLDGGPEPTTLLTGQLPEGVKVTDLSESARKILLLAADNPDLTNAEKARLVRIGLSEWDAWVAAHIGATDDQTDHEG